MSTNVFTQEERKIVEAECPEGFVTQWHYVQSTFDPSSFVYVPKPNFEHHDEPNETSVLQIVDNVAEAEEAKDTSETQASPVPEVQETDSVIKRIKELIEKPNFGDENSYLTQEILRLKGLPKSKLTKLEIAMNKSKLKLMQEHSPQNSKNVVWHQKRYCRELARVNEKALKILNRREIERERENDKRIREYANFVKTHTETVTDDGTVQKKEWRGPLDTVFETDIPTNWKAMKKFLNHYTMVEDVWIPTWEVKKKHLALSGMELAKVDFDTSRLGLWESIMHEKWLKQRNMGKRDVYNIYNPTTKEIDQYNEDDVDLLPKTQVAHLIEQNFKFSDASVRDQVRNKIRDNFCEGAPMTALLTTDQQKLILRWFNQYVIDKK
jgi:hypothetical protein